MHLSPLIWIAVILLAYYVIFGRQKDGTIRRAIRTMRTVNAVIAAYRKCDYESALQRAEDLKERFSEDGRVLLLTRLDATRVGKAQ